MALLLGAGLGVMLTSATTRVQSAAITVMNTNDSGGGSLRQAIADAAAGDTVDFAWNVTGTIRLTSGELVIDKSLTIEGPGTNVLAISGNNASRVLNVSTGNLNVTLSGLTIANGRASGVLALGGGIYSSSTGTVSIINSKITGNSAVGSGSGDTGAWGGGIFNGGATLNILNSTFMSNSVSAAGADTNFSNLSRGGAIFNAGPLNITGSSLLDNSASASGGNGGRAEGGAIYHVAADTNSSPGEVNIMSSTLAGNSASGKDGDTLNLGLGGAIYDDSTNGLNIGNSMFSSNFASASGIESFNVAAGGAIYNDLSNRVNLSSSTFTGNSVSADGDYSRRLAEGGAIRNNRGTFDISGSTFTRNSASTSGAFGNDGGSGGGIANANTPMIIKNTIIAGNSVRSGPRTCCGPDTAGFFFTSQGYNLIGNNEATFGLSAGNPNANNDFVGTSAAPIDPLLGLLQDNGGPTWTHAPLANSPVIDKGNAFGVATDQRGVLRWQGAGPDIGAVEQTFVTMRRTFGGFIISYEGVSGEVYSLQYSSDLVRWEEFSREVSPVSAGRSGNAAAEFYRALLLP